MMPDNEADYGDYEPEPDEDSDLTELTPEALVWQLLLLINPGDEDTALRHENNAPVPGFVVTAHKPA